MELFFVILFIIIVWGICISVKEREKVNKMTPSEKEEYLRQQEEHKRKIEETYNKNIYNEYKYTCPMCGSHKIKNISKTNRGISFALFGAGSDKIGKLYECDDCKYKW